MYCPNCGKEIPDGSKFCKECGANIKESVAEKPKPAAAPAPVLEKGKMLCPKCGKTIPDWSLTCPICGFPVKAYMEAFKEQKEDPDVKPEKESLPNSTLSIAAVILALTVTVLGFIFGLIDLIQNDPTKKHTLSIAAICISVMATLIYIAMIPAFAKLFS